MVFVFRTQLDLVMPLPYLRSAHLESTLQLICKLVKTVLKVIIVLIRLLCLRFAHLELIKIKQDKLIAKFVQLVNTVCMVQLLWQIAQLVLNVRWVGFHRRNVPLAIFQMLMLRNAQSVQIGRNVKALEYQPRQWLIVQLICIATRHLMEHCRSIDYAQLELRAQQEVLPLLANAQSV